MHLDSLLSRARHVMMKGIGRRRGCAWHCSIHWSAQLAEGYPRDLEVHPKVIIGRHVWLNTPRHTNQQQDELRSRISIGAGSAIGRRNVISAKNRVEIQQHVVTAPNVLLMDHAHEFSDPNTPILHQGVTEGGTLVVESGCWIGYGVVILANRGKVVIGSNSVVAANSVVTGSVPPHCIVAGSPARVIRRYDEDTKQWERVNDDRE